MRSRAVAFLNRPAGQGSALTYHQAAERRGITSLPPRPVSNCSVPLPLPLQPGQIERPPPDRTARSAFTR